MFVVVLRGGRQTDHQMSATSNRCIAMKQCSRFLRGKRKNGSKVVRLYTMKALKESRGILPIVLDIDIIVITSCETLLLL